MADDENIDIPTEKEVILSPVAGAVSKKSEGTVNKDGFVKGQEVGVKDLLQHMAKERQKKK